MGESMLQVKWGASATAVLKCAAAQALASLFTLSVSFFLSVSSLAIARLMLQSYWKIPDEDRLPSVSSHLLNLIDCDSAVNQGHPGQSLI